ncbi:MAG: efflux RND transporter periplasmic adaptor subunit [Methylocystis sp.]
MNFEPTIGASLRAGRADGGRARRIRRLLVLWTAVTVTLSVLGFAFWRWSDARHGASASKGEASATPVGVAVAAKGDLEVTLKALGTVTPLSTVAVKAQISGRVTRIGFKEGQMVKEGDLLAEIDPRPYRHALRQAQGQLIRDKALLDNARLDFERYGRLAAQKFVSRQQLDTQASLVRQYKGLVEIDEANVENAALNLEYCRIVAPVAGRVGLRQIDLGNYVQAGGDSLAVLTRLQPIAVVFPVAEDRLPQMMEALRAGKKPSVTIYDRTGRRVIAHGEVAGLDSQIDPTTGTVKFKAQFDNANLSLFPNQFVNVRVVAETLREAIIVPTSAVQYGPKGPFAYVVSADNVAVARPIELGWAEGEKTVVVSGLKAGDRLVVAGADRLRDGARVKALEE